MKSIIISIVVFFAACSCNDTVTPPDSHEFHLPCNNGAKEFDSCEMDDWPGYCIGESNPECYYGCKSEDKCPGDLHPVPYGLTDICICL